MSLLHTDHLLAYYGDFQALYGITLKVEEGETVALIGANGAGKSTFLRALTGLVKHGGGAVHFSGESISTLPAHKILTRGIALVPEGRRLFPSLSVEENLRMGGYTKRPGPWTLERVYELFPALRDHAKRPSTALSGGQQQMVAIGRALMSNPRLLLCDEISLGLAPIVIRDIYAALPRIKAEGCSVLLVEQDTGQALRVSDRVYCFQEGRVSLEGRPAELTRDQISRAYFGV
ncbi:MAG: ABC transporter ATP-binding protein [Acidocella sp.]|nr:ABC transporter ATP-binding protein [Acidocella sp.]MDR3719418.1 ABC transporter ATP-binding protein [Bryobacteraceae bacterium]